jgi:hypothetical protein
MLLLLNHFKCSVPLLLSAREAKAFAFFDVKQKMRVANKTMWQQIMSMCKRPIYAYKQHLFKITPQMLFRNARTAQEAARKALLRMLPEQFAFRENQAPLCLRSRTGNSRGIFPLLYAT